MPVLADIHYGLHSVLSADISGIDADLAGATFGSGNGQPVVEMDIRYQRQNAFLADLGKAPGSLHIGNRQPGDLAPGRCQGPDLSQAPLYIRGLGIEHGLDDHIRPAANGHVAHHNASCHISLPLYRKNDILKQQ